MLFIYVRDSIKLDTRGLWHLWCLVWTWSDPDHLKLGVNVPGHLVFIIIHIMHFAYHPYETFSIADLLILPLFEDNCWLWEVGGGLQSCDSCCMNHKLRSVNRLHDLKKEKPFSSHCCHCLSCCLQMRALIQTSVILADEANRRMAMKERQVALQHSWCLCIRDDEIDFVLCSVSCLTCCGRRYSHVLLCLMML